MKLYQRTLKVTGLAGALLLTGCVTSAIKADSLPELEVDASVVTNLFDDSDVATQCSQASNSSEPQTCTVEDMLSFTSAKTENSRKTLGALLLMSSDEICYGYLESISTTEKTARSFLGVSSLLLSGAAGVSSPVASANILSALSTASQGIEDELSNSILGGADGDLLLEAVRKGRKRQREAMANLLLGGYDAEGKEIAPDYYRFIAELSTYHDSCGISYGRQVLRNEIGEQDDDEAPTGTEVSEHKSRLSTTDPTDGETADEDDIEVPVPDVENPQPTEPEDSVETDSDADTN